MINKPSENVLVGGIEAGGTRLNCVVGYGNGDVIASHTFPTTDPQQTLARASEFFDESVSLYGPVHALGIAHFGPVETDDTSENYGRILDTPKPGWSNTDIVGYFSDIFSFPIAFQSDVNGAAIGEYYLGSAQGVDNFVYVTIGTGIGGGVFVNGELLNNLRHPEIGHMLVPQDIMKDSFKGCCPFHGNCLEGLASGIAIKNRWGSAAELLTNNHQVWELEAHYLALLCVNLTCCYAPGKIIFGGGVMQQDQIITLLQEQFILLMQGYTPTIYSPLVEDYVLQSTLAGNAGTKGALILASQAYDSHNGIFISSFHDYSKSKSRA